ncbi:MAG TPA: hypothetical protein PLB10_13015 [Thiolinea sp.]|nr:hypothetical protein [Thiolinea sp.]
MSHIQRTITLTFITLLLAACTPKPVTNSEPVTTAPAAQTPVTQNKITRAAATTTAARTETECTAAGGQWGYISRGSKGCNYPYSDGGKTCTSNEQCESQACLATNPMKTTEGKCAGNTFAKTNSCLGRIVSGKRVPFPCP